MYLISISVRCVCVGGVFVLTVPFTQHSVLVLWMYYLFLFLRIMTIDDIFVILFSLYNLPPLICTVLFVLASIFCVRGCPHMLGNSYFFMIIGNKVVD